MRKSYYGTANVSLITDEDLDILLGNLRRDMESAFDLDPISTSEEPEHFEIKVLGTQKVFEIKCECGAEKCGFPKHSDYCPKYEA
jgi:hypothetical protein